MALHSLPAIAAEQSNHPLADDLTKRHRNDIDGLRAIAVLSVLGFHTVCPGFGGGFVGVDIFFVISGYLICGILLRDLEKGRFSIARFYERRCKRILPALIVVLAFCMLAGLLILSPLEARNLGKGVMASIFSFSNVQFYLQGSYFDQGGALNPLLMTWSLAGEEQFYIVFPLLLLVTYKFARKHLFAVLAAGCLVSLAFSIFCEFRHPEFNFYMPLTRAWELGAGALLAVWQTHRGVRSAVPGWVLQVAGIAGLVTVIVCVAFYSSAMRFPGFEALPPVLGTVLLLFAGGSRANRLLGLRPLRAVGQISYSLYLWHWPLLAFGAIVTSGKTPPPARAALMLLALVAAILSFFFVESPFRAATSARTSRVLVSYATAMTVIFLCGFFVVKSNGVAFRASHLATIEEEAGLDQPHPCLVPADRGPRLDALCVPPPDGRDTVALLGDSHADSIESTVRQRVEGDGKQLLVLASFSCPPLRGVTRLMPKTPQFAQNCASFNDQALELVANRSDVKTVYLAGSWPIVEADHFVPSGFEGDVAQLPTRASAQNLVQGIEGEIRALESHGKAVVLIDEWPSLDFVPLDALKSRELPVRRVFRQLLVGKGPDAERIDSVSRAETVPQDGEWTSDQLRSFSSNDPHVRFVDSKAILCPEGRCLVTYGDRVLYADANHVNQLGAELILGRAAGLGPRGNPAPTSEGSR